MMMSATDDNSDQHGGGGDMISSKKECTSCEQNNVDDITEGIGSIALQDDISTCANCGKEGNSDDMNTCNKCKTVKYCNAACKKKHRHKHKKDCEEHLRLAAERAAELHDIELFKQPPPNEDCPICFQLLPTLDMGRRYRSCCGKVICSGCNNAPLYDDQGNRVDNTKCPFCRIAFPKKNEESLERFKKRVEKDDPIAIHNLGCCYRNGEFGFKQDDTKALELLHRSGELGYSMSYNIIGYAYSSGQGVEVDEKKAIYYYEQAAIGGSEEARCNLGNKEAQRGNFDRALKHWMIAVRSGYPKSLEAIKLLYSNGHATKEDYTEALRSYQTYLGKIKSVQRDNSAAAQEDYRYY